jgi:hypothetical protein
MILLNPKPDASGATYWITMYSLFHVIITILKTRFCLIFDVTDTNKTKHVYLTSENCLFRSLITTLFTLLGFHLNYTYH